MKLILSDRDFALPLGRDVRLICLNSLNIRPCTGCFGCWVKTPGKCVIRDDAVRVYPCIAQSDEVLYISRLRYGGYDTPMKTMLERSLPIQQPFIRLYEGETHHVQRDVTPKKATILAYGDPSAEERQIFRRLVQRNAKNMCFQSYRVLFVPEPSLLQTVESEVRKWATS